MTLTYGSLFAGVGGFDMGMEQAGYKPVFQVEWDKNCQKILHHHWPTVPKWGDVCDVNGADLPPCDVLIFGSPCQDLSVAGKRAGLQDGDRSSMFFEAVRIIKEMRDATNSIYPRATIWENVPGALSSNKGADFGVVLSSLADIGAITQEYAVLDAQYFGVPQRRRRIFLVSIFDSAASERCPDPLLPLIQGSRGDFAKGRKARKDFARLASTSIDSGNGEGFRKLALSHFVSDDTASTIKVRDHKEATDLVVPFVKSRRAQNDTDDETWVEGDVTPTLNAFDNGGETRATVLMPVAYSIREDAKANNFSATETDTALCLNGLVPSTQSHHAQIFIAEPIIFENSYRDGPRVGDDICHTLPAKMGLGGGNTPMLAEPVEHRLDVRRLTPLECERLMGWPDDHTRWTADGKEQADTNRYKQCGNGVASPVARWVGEQLRPVLETE
jgi:DNA (cytosine-5)-methyltransferase 1